MPLRTIIIKATRSGTASTVIIRRGASGTGTGGGVTDHGALDGLGDDDHTQYAKVAATNNFTATQSFAERIYLTEAVLGVVTSPIAGAYNGPGTGLTGTAANLSVGTATTAAYATTAGTANALAGILPITSGGTGAASESAARTALKVPGSIAGVGGSIAISNIVSISLANYNLIGTKDPTTLYVING